jgi:hypothetical protein
LTFAKWSAGKDEQQVTNLMKTIDYSKAVKPTVLKAGDKVYRFERINTKGESEMHFFTDAHGADAGATGVGFYNQSGYLSCCIFLFACKGNQPGDIYNIGNFDRVTSGSDSARNMYVASGKEPREHRKRLLQKTLP